VTRAPRRGQPGRRRDPARDWLIALAAAALLATTAPAAAHAVLVRSAPASRTTLREPPARVELWFNERLEPAFSGVSVWSAAGAQVDRRDAAVDPGDPKRLSVSLPPMAPGEYVVRFRVLSVDGHIAEGSFSFRVVARG
jgi:methionine-rich copper-binding protein CopC